MDPEEHRKTSVLSHIQRSEDIQVQALFVLTFCRTAAQLWTAWTEFRSIESSIRKRLIHRWFPAFGSCVLNTEIDPRVNLAIRVTWRRSYPRYSLENWVLRLRIDPAWLGDEASANGKDKSSRRRMTRLNTDFRCISSNAFRLQWPSLLYSDTDLDSDIWQNITRGLRVFPCL